MAEDDYIMPVGTGGEKRRATVLTPAELATLRDLRAGRLVAVEGWQPIETAPKDGSWFVIARFGTANELFEVGRYDPSVFPRYIPVGDGLFRMEEEKVYDWRGFNNFSRATHWMPLPAPPAAKEEGNG